MDGQRHGTPFLYTYGVFQQSTLIGLGATIAPVAPELDAASPAKHGLQQIFVLLHHQQVYGPLSSQRTTERKQDTDFERFFTSILPWLVGDSLSVQYTQTDRCCWFSSTFFWRDSSNSAQRAQRRKERLQPAPLRMDKL